MIWRHAREAQCSGAGLYASACLAAGRALIIVAMDASATSEQQRINRLLIVGCSRAKRKTEQMLPALERYDG